MIRVAVLDDYQGMALSLADWQSLHPDAQIEAFPNHIESEEDLAQRLHAYEAVVLMRERTPFRKSLIDKLPNLRLIISTGMYNASIDAEAAAARGIFVAGTDSLGYPTAELTWGLVLALCRNIQREGAALRRGSWQETVGVGLRGKTLGILGLGRLGSEVAKFGQAFGMKIIAWSQNLTETRAAEQGAHYVGKEALFEQADLITIHLVLSPRSRGLVGAAELGRMKRTAFLVNTSRGPIVDETALIAALRARRIAGAALDVYDTEPLPKEHPILALDNVVLTPHLGYVTAENYRTQYGQAVENIRAFLDGKPIRPLKTRGK